MPSENKTPNYELNQWQGNEYLKRQDLVDDNSKIDAALTPTADPTKIPTSNGPFKLVNWVSYFANRIKAITGKANWWESPSKTLEDVNTHLADTMPHRFVDEGKTYRYGLSVVNGVVTMNYEEVI